ncbi:MAG: DUF2225 domain-containing protein [Lachnospiraceae bacterium]|nr:DUF2225 domain-containing protein [Lachnospiraceae bacterium]
MAGLLSGLSSLGLGNLESAKVFEEPEKEKAQSNEPEVHKVEEKELVYDRGFECPVCDSKITSKVMKSGKAKLEGTDMDLRPRYEGIDPLKYDVILCPKCGFTALTRYFKAMTPMQVRLIKENISKNVQLHPFNGETYTYEEAMERYKLALACAVVRQAKASEKAYICLKSAWVLRGWKESLDEKAADYQANKKELESAEVEYLKNALEGFTGAIANESFPMCGMDETTMDYLLAVLAMKFGQYDVSSKLIANILVSPSANARMKDKARELKDMIVAEIRKAK